MIQRSRNLDRGIQSVQGEEVISGQVSRNVFVVPHVRLRNKMQRVFRARLRKPIYATHHGWKDTGGKFLVICDPVVFAEGPHGLSPAVVLIGLRKKITEIGRASCRERV